MNLLISLVSLINLFNLVNKLPCFMKWFQFNEIYDFGYERMQTDHR